MCAPCLPKDVPSRILIGVGFCVGHGLVDGLMLKPVYDAGGAGRIFIAAFTPFWAVFTVIWFWSYIVTCWLDSGSVERELKRMRLDLRSLPPEFDEVPRCPKCGVPKPKRTHHCSQCNKCYFRFDHHCNIIGNCVAFANTKPFMLFLFYSGLMLFLLGLEVGSNRDLAGGLSSLGLQALLFAAAGICGSVLASVILYRLVFRKGRSGSAGAGEEGRR